MKEKQKKKSFFKKFTGIILTFVMVFTMMSLGSVVVFADTLPKDVTFNTNQGKYSYSNTDITITCTHAGDGDGLKINDTETMTITASTGFYIDKVELTVGWYSSNSGYLVTTSGTLSGNTAGSTLITNSGINATSATYNTSISPLQFCTVKVYYKDSTDLKDCTISTIADQTYTESQITPEPTVKYGEVTLEKDVDYTLEYGTNVNVADGGTVTVKGKGIYGGSKSANFTITPAEFTIELSQNEFTYDGKAHVPTYTVKGVDGKVLTEGDDYHVSVAGGVVSKQIEVGDVEMTFYADNSNYKDAKASYKIVNPKTNDSSNTVILFIVMSACAAILAAAYKIKSSR